MSFLVIKLKAFNVKSNIVFRIELHKVLSCGNTIVMEKLGFYNTDPFKKIISIKSDRLGFWLNKGAFINPSVYKLLKNFLAREI